MFPKESESELSYSEGTSLCNLSVSPFYLSLISQDLVNNIHFLMKNMLYPCKRRFLQVRNANFRSKRCKKPNKTQ